MSNQRRLRRAKRARRDQRRAQARAAESCADTTLSDIIRKALARRHPGNLLCLASMVIDVATPETLPSRTAAHVDSGRLDQLLTSLIGLRNRETTALLAVIAELLVDDPALQLRCRDALSRRDEHLPRWINELSRVDVYRAVRRTHVLGDVDELVIGARLGDEHELCVGVLIDHNAFSSIADAVVLRDPIDAVVAQQAGASSDAQIVEMSLIDARAWIEDALSEPVLALDTETWPLYRPLVRWLIERLPEGGEHRSPSCDWKSAIRLCDKFFTSNVAAPFTSSSHRDLLLELFETGSGDPLRWSEARVELAIGRPFYDDGFIPLEVMLDAPDLLRAFIPFAHAQSAIRDELTQLAVDAIDKLRPSYKREVLRQALDDAV